MWIVLSCGQKQSRYGQHNSSWCSFSKSMNTPLYTLNGFWYCEILRFLWQTGMFFYFSCICRNSCFHEVQIPTLLFIFSQFLRLLAQIYALFKAFQAFLQVSLHPWTNIIRKMIIGLLRRRNKQENFKDWGYEIGHLKVHIEMHARSFSILCSTPP